jgi:thiol:disulfide interchange protein DsbD
MPNVRVIATTLALAWACFIAPAARAQAPAETPLVLLGGPGATPGTAVVRFDLQGDWHVNKAFVEVTLQEGVTSPTLGTITLPAGEVSGKPEDGSLREDYTHDFDLAVPFTGEAKELKLDVRYQACKGASLCLMPTSQALTIDLAAAPLPPLPPPPAPAAAEKATPAPPVADAAPAAPPSDAFAAAKEQGALALVLVCFLAGLGVSLTPCVLPMVPITMGLIGARGAGSRLQAVALSAMYVLGLAIVYTGLGVFAGVTGALFGSWLQSAWVVGSIAFFFFVMGLSMFGLFDVAVPDSLQEKFSGKGGGGSAGGAFVLGMIGAVLAGPCSGPVVVSVLALIGQGGQVALGAGLMFAFSLGMGMIFLVTGAASGWMPSRGAWMATVKKGFGIVMWLGAIYYVAPQLPDVVTALLTAVVLLGTGVFAWPDPDDGEGFVLRRLRITYALIGGIVGAWLLVATMLTKGFILPPVALGGGSAVVGAPAGAVTWLASEEQALALAQKEGKPLVIDFTAEWCAACHELDRFTFSDPGVAAEITGAYVALRVDCTDRADAKVKAIQEKYGVLGLPTVVFAKPDGTRIDNTVGFVPATEFLPRLVSARAAVGG